MLLWLAYRRLVDHVVFAFRARSFPVKSGTNGVKLLVDPLLEEKEAHGINGQVYKAGIGED